MVTINCDVCRKKMDNPALPFFYFGEFSICETCRDNLESQIRPAIRGKAPFATDWYDKFVRDSITKAIQKGK